MGLEHNQFPQPKTWPASSEKKGYSFELRYAKLAPHVWQALEKLPRTGWVDRDVTNPESVADHTVALRKLVLDNRESLTEFSDAEIQDLLDMLEIHDWAESNPEVGDQVIIWKNEEEKKRLKDEKFKKEYAAMSEICGHLGEEGKHIFSLWMRYVEKKDPVAVFAKQADKYQAMALAFEYEQRGENVSTREFIDHDNEIMKHPFFVKKLEELEKKLELLKNGEHKKPYWPTPEEKKRVIFEPEYFNIQIEFAKTIAQKTGSALPDVLIEYTDFFRRFGLGQKLDPQNPRWREYLNGIEKGNDPVALSHDFYLHPPEKQKDKKEKKESRVFGSFKYDYKDGIVHLHFVNSGQDNITKIDTIKNDLTALFDSVSRGHPQAKQVEARSWLLGTAVPRRFLPEAYLNRVRLQADNFQAGSRWGQFVDHTGKVKMKQRDLFLIYLKTLDMKIIAAAFPVQTYEAEGPIEDFYSFYGIEKPASSFGLMSFEEYAKIEHETPYVYELKKGDKELAYFGAEHSNDISNPQFERLQKKFEEIKPDIVFVEGIDWLDERKDFARTRIEETSIEDLTTGLGEPGYALKLAVDAGADFSSPEPKYQNEITALIEKGFSKDEVFTFYIYRQIEQYYRSQITNKPIEEYLKEYLDEIETKTKWEHFDYSLNHLEEVGRQVWGEKADIHNPEYAPQRITPTPGEYGDDMQTVIMKVAQESNQFRNAYMIEKIKEALKTHKKLFVVYGASHGVMQEKAIRKIFDEIA